MSLLFTMLQETLEQRRRTSDLFIPQKHSPTTTASWLWVFSDKLIQRTQRLSLSESGIVVFFYIEGHGRVMAALEGLTSIKHEMSRAFYHC